MSVTPSIKLGRRRNLRLALILASVAATFFIGFVAKITLLSALTPATVPTLAHVRIAANAPLPARAARVRVWACSRPMWPWWASWR